MSPSETKYIGICITKTLQRACSKASHRSKEGMTNLQCAPWHQAARQTQQTACRTHPCPSHSTSTGNWVFVYALLRIGVLRVGFVDNARHRRDSVSCSHHWALHMGVVVNGVIQGTVRTTASATKRSTGELSVKQLPASHRTVRYYRLSEHRRP